MLKYFNLLFFFIQTERCQNSCHSSPNRPFFFFFFRVIARGIVPREIMKCLSLQLPKKESTDFSCKISIFDFTVLVASVTYCLRTDHFHTLRAKFSTTARILQHGDSGSWQCFFLWCSAGNMAAQSFNLGHSSTQVLKLWIIPMPLWAPERYQGFPLLSS